MSKLKNTNLPQINLDIIKKSCTTRYEMAKLLNSTTVKTLNQLLNFCNISLQKPAPRFRKIRLIIQYIERENIA